MSDFNLRLVTLLKENSLSQKEVALKANITESAMSYYVKGVRTPSGEVLSRIAKVLNTTTDYLLGNTDKKDVNTSVEELKYLQRNLGKLDPEQLRRAEIILKTAFNDIFDDDEE